MRYSVTGGNTKMTRADGLTAIKGELLRFLLTDDYGVGEAQCPRKRVIQCANIPRHEQKKASEALDDMIRDTSVPVYSGKGGSRDVLQLNASKLLKLKQLCNKWHPDRTEGETFDPTDLSEGPKQVEETFSIVYDYKGKVWNVLERSEVDFDHEHGSLVDGVPPDHLAFKISGREKEVEKTISTLIEETSGGVHMYESENNSVVAVTA